MIEMNCKGCVFAKIENSEQTGCFLNRDEKLGINRKNDGFLVLNRFCNTYRPEKWLENLSFEEIENRKETVLNEVVPRVGFLVFFDVEKDNPLNYLESTLMNIRDQEDFNASYVVVANPKVEFNEAIFDMLNLFFKPKCKYHILQLTKDFSDKRFIIDEAFKHFVNGWSYVTTSGECVPRDLIKVINKRINIDMKILSVILPYDGINGLLFQNALFKHLNGNGKKRIDEEHFDNRPFLEKIVDMDKNSSILQWSDIYES